MFKVDYNLKLWISWHKYVLPCRLRQTRPFKIVVENKVEICVLLCHRNTALCRFGCPALRALTGIVCFNRMHSKKKPRAPALNENYASFSVSVTLISINIYAIRRAVQHTIKSVQFDNHRHSLWPLIFISATTWLHRSPGPSQEQRHGRAHWHTAISDQRTHAGRQSTPFQNIMCP